MANQSTAPTPGTCYVTNKYGEHQLRCKTDTGFVILGTIDSELLALHVSELLNTSGADVLSLIRTRSDELHAIRNVA
jgi:hypothetical protein